MLNADASSIMTRKYPNQMKRLTALQRQIASVMVRCESTEDMVAVGESELDDVMNEKGN